MVLFDRGKEGVKGLFLWVVKGTPIDLNSLLPVATRVLFDTGKIATQHGAIDVLTAELSAASLPRTFPEDDMLEGMFDKKKFIDKDTMRYVGNVSINGESSTDLEWLDVGPGLREACSGFGRPEGLIQRTDDFPTIPVRPSFMGAVDVNALQSGETVIDLKSYLPPFTNNVGRKKWRVIILSKARRNNRSNDFATTDWDFAFLQEQGFIPKGSFLSLESLFWIMVPLEFSKMAFWGGKRDTFTLRPLTTDYEFAVNLITASIIESWLVLTTKNWWTSGSWIMDATWKDEMEINLESLQEGVDTTASNVLALFSRRLQAFACTNYPTATWDMPKDYSTDRQGKIRVHYHKDLLRIQDLSDELRMPKKERRQDPETREWDWVVSDSYPDPATKPNQCLDWIWDDFQDVYAFVLQAWRNAVIGLKSKMDRLKKLRTSLLQLKEMEEDLPFMMRWLPRSNIPWESARLSWSLWLNIPQVR